MIYFPTEPEERVEGSTTILEAEAETLEISVRKVSERAIIYFGGNAEDVSTTLPELADIFGEHSLYLMHYRGYGNSTGKPTEKALVSDALALYDMVAAEADEISVIGRSLGSALAIRLAVERPIAKLVLVTPFDSILNIARRRFPYLPVRILLIDKFESWRYAPLIETPTLIIIAADDEIVPVESSLLLAKKFDRNFCESLIIESAGHNSISHYEEYKNAISEWIETSSTFDNEN